MRVQFVTFVCVWGGWVLAAPSIVNQILHDHMLVCVLHTSVLSSQQTLVQESSDMRSHSVRSPFHIGSVRGIQGVWFRGKKRLRYQAPNVNLRLHTHRTAQQE